jgi:hypothetical protein
MARIVMVHGAFNELWGPNELKARWLPALRDGLWHHGAEVDDDEVAVCFYGDLFRLDPETVDEEKWHTTRAGAAEMLSGLTGAGTVEALSQAANDQAWERTVDMVAILASDPTVAQRGRQRFLDQVGPDTQVVVAHSLGTVVSYQVLAAHPELQPDLLVTLGSPLGTPTVDGILQPPLVDGRGAWPGSVRRWVNVAAVGDRATGTGRLADRFGDRVEDRRIDNGHRAHDPEPYLNSAVTGGVIAEALAARPAAS